MKLIVGLGNPGRRYLRTRHNVGFMVLDRVAQRLGAEFTKEKYLAQIAETQHQNETLTLLKPLTYMNRSGESVARALRYNNLNRENDLLIIYDEADLPLGKLRLRRGGSAGTHNGMKSVLQHLPTTEVPRLRIGVGANNKTQSLTGHVLGKFTPKERPILEDSIELSVEAVLLFTVSGMEAAMNAYNR